MPYDMTSRKAEVFCRVGPVVLYCTYKDDDMSSNPPYQYWFCLWPYSNNDAGIDIRDFPGWKEEEQPSPDMKDPKWYQKVLKADRAWRRKFVKALLDSGTFFTKLKQLMEEQGSSEEEEEAFNEMEKAWKQNLI